MLVEASVIIEFETARDDSSFSGSEGCATIPSSGEVVNISGDNNDGDEKEAPGASTEGLGYGVIGKDD